MTFKKRHTIEESYKYKSLETIISNITIKVKSKDLEKYLPSQYIKLYQNFISDNIHPDETVSDFYTYAGRNTPLIFDYIPVGYNNGDYLAYHIPTKKLYGLQHDVWYIDKPPMTPLKDHFSTYAEHLLNSVCCKDLKNIFTTKSDADKVLSKFLGFSAEFDSSEWKENNFECFSFEPKNNKDLLNNFGSKKLYDKIKKFELKLKSQYKDLK